MAVKIQMRRDSVVNWENIDPVLSKGEWGVAYNVNTLASIKIGNGISHWNDLDAVWPVESNSTVNYAEQLAMPPLAIWRERRTLVADEPEEIMTTQEITGDLNLIAWPDNWSNGLIYQDGELWNYQLGLQRTPQVGGIVAGRVDGDNWLADQFFIDWEDLGAEATADGYGGGGGPVLAASGTTFGLVAHMEPYPTGASFKFGLVKFADVRDTNPVYLGDLIHPQNMVNVVQGPGTLVVLDGNVLIYFDEENHQSVARCSLGEWTSAIDENRVPEFLKWDGEDFTGDQFTGLGAPLSGPYVADVANLSNGSLISLNISGTAGNITYSTSSDGVTWSDNITISEAYGTEEWDDVEWYSCTIYSGNPEAPKLIEDREFQSIISSHYNPNNNARWDHVRLLRVSIWPFDIDPRTDEEVDLSALTTRLDSLEDQAEETDLQIVNGKTLAFPLAELADSLPVTGDLVSMEDLLVGAALGGGTDLSLAGGVTLIPNTEFPSGAVSFAPTGEILGVLVKGVQFEGSLVNSKVSIDLTSFTGGGRGIVSFRGEGEENWTQLNDGGALVTSVSSILANGPVDIVILPEEAIVSTGSGEAIFLIGSFLITGSSGTHPTSITLDSVEWLVPAAAGGLSEEDALAIVSEAITDHVEDTDPHGDRAYADTLIAANDALVLMGVIDASTNPDYPAGDAGHTYVITVAGKIGGASGANVEVNDRILCLTDGSVEGSQVLTGANWSIVQGNLDGAVIGPSSGAVTNNHLAAWDGTSGRLLKDSGILLGDVVLTGDSRLTDQRTPTDLSVVTGKLADGAVTLAKHANMSTGNILARTTAGSGPPEEISFAAAATAMGAATTAIAPGMRGVDSSRVTGVAKGLWAAVAGGPTTLAIAAGEQILVLSQRWGQILKSIQVLASASALTSGQQIEFSCYEDKADGGPGVRLWNAVMTPPTSTTLTGLTLQDPMGPAWIGITNPSGNSGSITLRSAVVQELPRLVAMQNANFFPTMRRTGQAAASSDLSALVFREAIGAPALNIQVDYSNTFPVVGIGI